MELQLNEDHELQIQGYLRFAKLKREQHVRETLSTIKEFQRENLQKGDMYNYDEAFKLFEQMKEEVRALVDKEIQHAYHTNALLAKTLIKEAEDQGISLNIKTADLENELLLGQIAHSEQVALGKSASDFARKNQQLASLSAQKADDSDLGRRNKHLQEENASMAQRMHKLQEQVTNVMRERSALNEEILSLKDQLFNDQSSLGESKAQNQSGLSKLQSEFAALSAQAQEGAQESKQHVEQLEKQLQEHREMLDDTRKELASCKEGLSMKEAQLRSAQDAVNGKLQDSVQFQQLRKLMAAKTNEVVELRKKLGQDTEIPSADD